MPRQAATVADQTRAQRTLARVLAREHHASAAPIDREAETAQRTLAKEHHAYPAPADGPMAANARHAAPSGTFPLLPVLAVVGLIVVLATAVTWLRLRARSRPREAT